MKEKTGLLKWILHHTWAILVCYLVSMIVLLFIHGGFGFTMSDDGTYLSNAVMHIGSGIVLALGIGLVQRELLGKRIRLSFLWVLYLIIGFVVAETIAGIVLWKLEIYRGLINIFNCNNHLPEAAIFALAGLISGILQAGMLRPHIGRSYLWIIFSTLGWGMFIISSYAGLFAIVLGPMIYSALTGFALRDILQTQGGNDN